MLLSKDDLQLTPKDFTFKVLKLYYDKYITREQMKQAQDWHAKHYRTRKLTPNEIEMCFNQPISKNIPIVDNLTLDL